MLLSRSRSSTSIRSSSSRSSPFCEWRGFAGIPTQVALAIPALQGRVDRGWVHLYSGTTLSERILAVPQGGDETVLVQKVLVQTVNGGQAVARAGQDSPLRSCSTVRSSP